LADPRSLRKPLNLDVIRRRHIQGLLQQVSLNQSEIQPFVVEACVAVGT
jgi:hypothetical protein